MVYIEKNNKLFSLDLTRLSSALAQKIEQERLKK